MGSQMNRYYIRDTKCSFVSDAQNMDRRSRKRNKAVGISIEGLHLISPDSRFICMQFFHTQCPFDYHVTYEQPSSPLMSWCKS